MRPDHQYYSLKSSSKYIIPGRWREVSTAGKLFHYAIVKWVFLTHLGIPKEHFRLA